MKPLVEFSIDQGDHVLVEVDQPHGGSMTHGLGKNRSTLLEEAGRGPECAIEAVTPVRGLIVQLQAIDDPPNKLDIEFGMLLTAHTKAFIAPAAVEADFKVSMTWQRRIDENMVG